MSIAVMEEDVRHASSGGSGTDRRRKKSDPGRRGSKAKLAIETADTKSRSKSRTRRKSGSRRNSDERTYAGPPGFMVPGPSGQPVFVPAAYFPPQSSANSSPSRSSMRAVSNPQSRNSPVLYPYLPNYYHQGRYYTGPDTTRPPSSGSPTVARPGAPHPPSTWGSRSRSGSMLSNTMYPPSSPAVDPFQYMTYSPDGPNGITTVPELIDDVPRYAPAVSRRLPTSSLQRSSAPSLPRKSVAVASSSSAAPKPSKLAESHSAPALRSRGSRKKVARRESFSSSGSPTPVSSSDDQLRSRGRRSLKVPGTWADSASEVSNNATVPPPVVKDTKPKRRDEVRRRSKR